MLWTSTEGLGGPLIPSKAIAQLPFILGGFTNDQLFGPHLRVVALRFDPCFVEGTGPQACRHQIRLVWQRFSSKGRIDHGGRRGPSLFLRSFRQDWADFTVRYFALTKTQTFDEPVDQLTPHAQIAREGMTGPYWSRLRRLVLNFCGEKNLSRVTSMSINSHGVVWTFQRFNWSQGRRGTVS